MTYKSIRFVLPNGISTILIIPLLGHRIRGRGGGSTGLISTNVLHGMILQLLIFRWFCWSVWAKNLHPEAGRCGRLPHQWGSSCASSSADGPRLIDRLHRGEIQSGEQELSIQIVIHREAWQWTDSSIVDSLFLCISQRGQSEAIVDGFLWLD